MTKHFQQLKVTLAAAVVAASAGLAGCGGGDSTPAAPPSVSGAAVKGIVSNGVVTLYELASNDLNQKTQIGSGTTDAKGAFSFTFSNYQGGPVLMQVQGRKATETPRTTVTCDIGNANTANPCGAGTTYGQAYNVDDTFILTAMLPRLNADGTDRIFLTPLTHALKKLADTRLGAQTGTKDAHKAVAEALSVINQIAGGLDVVHTEPIDLTSSSERAAATARELAYTALISGLLRTNTTGTTDPQTALTATLSNVETELGDGTASATFLHDLATEGQQQLADAGEPADDSGVVADVEQNETDATNAGGEYTPTPDPNAGSPAVDKAKAFMQTVRDNAQSLKTVSNSDGAAFGQELDAARALTDSAVHSLGISLDLLVTQAAKFAQTAASGDSMHPVDEFQAPQPATITVSDSGSQRTVTITGAFRSETANITAMFPTTDPSTTAASPLQAVLTGSTLATTATDVPGVKLTIQTGNATLTARDPGQPMFSASGPTNVDKAEFNLDATLEQQNVPSPASPKTVEGILTFTVLSCTTSSCTSGAAANGVAASPTSLSFKGEIRDAAGKKLNGQVSFSQADASARSFDPNAAYSSTNFVNGNLTLSFNAAFPNLATAAAVLSATSTGFDDTVQKPIGSVSLILSRNGGDLLTITASNTAAAPEVHSFTVTNSAGAVLTFTQNTTGTHDEVFGTLAVDGVDIGTLEQSSSGVVLIRYADGSFETAFN